MNEPVKRGRKSRHWMYALRNIECCARLLLLNALQYLYEKMMEPSDDSLVTARITPLLLNLNAYRMPIEGMNHN